MVCFLTHCYCKSGSISLRRTNWNFFHFLVGVLSFYTHLFPTLPTAQVPPQPHISGLFHWVELNPIGLFERWDVVQATDREPAGAKDVGAGQCRTGVPNQLFCPASNFSQCVPQGARRSKFFGFERGHKLNYGNVYFLDEIIIANKFFLYVRKSSEVKEKHVMSIEAQFVKLGQYAQRENLHIAERFIESKSAKQPGQWIFGWLN